MLQPTSVTTLLGHGRKQKNPGVSWPANLVKNHQFRIKERFCLKIKVEKWFYVCWKESKTETDGWTNKCHGLRLEAGGQCLEIGFLPLWVLEIEFIYLGLDGKLFYPLSHLTDLTITLSQLARDSVEWWDPKKWKGNTWITQVIVYTSVWYAYREAQAIFAEDWSSYSVQECMFCFPYFRKLAVYNWAIEKSKNHTHETSLFKKILPTKVKMCMSSISLYSMPWHVQF